MTNTCKGCPYHLRANRNLAICTWDKHPVNPKGCNDAIVRIYRVSAQEGK